MTHRIDIEAAVDHAVAAMLEDPEGREVETERDDLLAVIYAWRDEHLTAARWLVGDWQANGNAAELGDPRADVWHKAARQLLAVLNGREAHGVDPAPASETEESER